MIEVEVHNTDVEVVSEIGVESTGNVTAEVVDLGDLDITVAKKEYVITGDSIYVPVLYEDAPQWMKDLVSLTVDVSIETANASTLAQLSSILATFATSYVPLNQYTQSINSLALADTNMQAVVETLNSNFNDGLNLANSQIINLQTTKASKTEVVTQVVDTLAAQLTTPDSDIGAVISNINQAIANEATARANSFNVLNTSLGNVGENVAGNSTAISGLQSSVTNINGTLTAQAGQITTLSNNLQSGSGTWANADTAVTNTLNSNITNGLATVESKWAYNSNIVINGNTYSSGFGLSNSAGTGVGSEFWINADKFKFTNNGKTGSKTPFSIDASDATPEIYFNGKVSFSNVTNVPQLGSTPQEVVTAINNAQTTTINGPRITTGSITASQIQSNSVSADRLIAGTSGSTVWTNGGLVSQNFNGNVYGNIGSPTAGFRLSSGAAGNTNDPNIYGAYIKGSTIEGITLNTSDIKVKAEGYPNNFGRVNYVTSGGSIVMPGVGTGYYMNRVCSSTLSYVKLEGWHRGATNSLSASLQYSLNGGTTWITLSSKNSQAYGYQEAFIIYFAELFPLGLPSVTDSVVFRITGDGSYAYSSPVLVTIYNN